MGLCVCVCVCYWLKMLRRSQYATCDDFECTVNYLHSYIAPFTFVQKVKYSANFEAPSHVCRDH